MAFFDQQPGYSPYGGDAGGSSSTPANLQFFGQQGHNMPFLSAPSNDPYGNLAAGSMSGTGPAAGSVGGVGGNMNAQKQMLLSDGRWWEAFGTCGFEGEPGLMEELGVKPSHILAKTLTVLNPFAKVDAHIMDDADLAGPLVFCFGFALALLLSGKPQFSYIYGVALLGTTAVYTLLNLMSETGIDAYRTASVLGYCLLPMVGLGGIGMAVGIDHPIGYILSSLSILWCTYSASSIFVSILHMSHQRLLVAYPVGLLYGCFAILSVFSVRKDGLGK